MFGRARELGALANEGVHGAPAGAIVKRPWGERSFYAVDPWGNRYRYRVTQAFAQRAPAAPFGLDTPGDIIVCPASALCGAGQALTVVAPMPNLNAPVALILSHGPNGWGGVNVTTATANAKPAGASALGNDESANANADATFVSRARIVDDGTNPSPEFDDIVVWLSPHTLKHRAVAAGKLP